MKVVSFGAVLWDILPRGIFLGGAPLNVAAHLSKIGAEAYMVSAVGNDFLGDEALERMKMHQVNTDWVEQHADLPTGTVKVILDTKGNASYTIHEGVAWDRILLRKALLEFVQKVDAVVFGSLDARSNYNLKTLTHILNEKGPLKIFDVNLRPPHDDIDLTFTLIKKADIIKLNEEELEKISGEAIESSGCEKLIKKLVEKTGLRRICVTRAEKGAIYFNDGYTINGSAIATEVRDTVGAGDAFMAAFIQGVVNGDADRDPDFINRCCRLGAFVASKDGAIPDYNPKKVFG